MQNDPAFARQALQAGAAGFVLKEAADDELLEAIRLAAAGDTYLNPSLGARLAAAPPEPAGPPDDLSERELDVLRLIALGHTNSEIAEQLFLSVRTVETHRAHIQQKTRRTAARRSSCATRSSTGSSRSDQRSSDGNGRSAGAAVTRTRASTTIAPSGPAISGLQSTSTISGCAPASADSRTSTSSTAATSARRRPAEAVEQRERRAARGPSRAASSPVTGASRDCDVAEQLDGSAARGARRRPGRSRDRLATPTSSSTPSAAISWTRNPVGSCPAARTAVAIAFAARVVAAAPA